MSATQFHQFVFPALKDYCADLRKLTVTINDAEASVFPSIILDSMLGLKRLQHLEIRALPMPFSPANLANLGVHCPELATLHLDVHFDHPSLYGCPAAPDISAELFPNLENLHITVRNASTYHIDANYSIALCSTWPKSLLTKLTSLTIVTSSSFYSYERLVGPLAQASSFRRLEFTHTAERVTHIRPADIVRAFPIPTVAEVIWDIRSLATPSSSENSTAFQEVIEAGFKSASSPKYLRTLVLPIKMPYPFSVTELRYVAENAIGLESLSICIDSSLRLQESIGPIDSEAKTVYKSTLRHLRICDQRQSGTFHPAEYRYLAEYLDTIFPNLHSLGVYKNSRGEGGYHGAHWEHIDHLRRKEKLIRALL
ncbi:hypothetical protein BKA70DRAFT_1307685 [Coprinopsis sp. MPI-PUGE-AT-0042]|nr:hypothetical protein BKA70DRAFT_1307685 [Coprinopsis sp. MPI-PUGE-AT-0042]